MTAIVGMALGKRLVPKHAKSGTQTSSQKNVHALINIFVYIFDVLSYDRYFKYLLLLALPQIRFLS